MSNVSVCCGGINPDESNNYQEVRIYTVKRSDRARLRGDPEGAFDLSGGVSADMCRWGDINKRAEEDSKSVNLFQKAYGLALKDLCEKAQKDADVDILVNPKIIYHNSTVRKQGDYARQGVLTMSVTADAYKRKTM